MNADDLRALIRSGQLRPMRARCWAVLVAIAAEYPQRVSARRIQALTGMSRRTVMRAVADLKTARILAKRCHRWH